MLLSSHF